MAHTQGSIPIKMAESEAVLLHNAGFCNGSITKRILPLQVFLRVKTNNIQNMTKTSASIRVGLLEQVSTVFIHTDGYIQARRLQETTYNNINQTLQYTFIFYQSAVVKLDHYMTNLSVL